MECISHRVSDKLPILLSWINFNPGMDTYLHHYYVWDEIIYPFLNFNGTTVEV